MASSSSGGQTVFGLQRKKGTNKRKVAVARTILNNMPTSDRHYDILDYVVLTKLSGKPVEYNLSVATSLKICQQILDHHWPEDSLQKVRTVISSFEDPYCLGCAIKLSSMLTTERLKNKPLQDMKKLGVDTKYINKLAEIIGYHANSIELIEFLGWAYVRVMSASSKNDSKIVEERASRVFQIYVDHMKKYNMDIGLEYVKEEIHAFGIVAQTEGLDLDRIKLEFVKPGTSDILNVEGRLTSSSASNIIPMKIE